ncbi:MAG: alpha/beta hydrolase [Fulvivirga sp.]|uniref:alpha/beta fold hydrolase n=1 Tax=Fulvivirga sp. TaxID=1931237 RepID=UPI0032EABCA4
MNRITKLFIIIPLVITTLGLAVFSMLYTPDIPLEALKEKYADEKSRFLNIEGINVHYQQIGKGPDLVLLHGTGASLHSWEGWVDNLKNDFRITTLDLPAFGLTGPNKEGVYTIDYYVDFLEKFTSELGIDEFYLAGNSLGGGIAWSFALNNSEKVKSLILVDASGYPSEEIPFVFKLARNNVTSWLLTTITPRSFIEGNLKEVYYDDTKITESLIDRYHQLTLSPGNRQAFVDRARHTMQYQYNRINELNMPVLILWGKYDEWVALEDAYAFEKDLENDQLIIYECGHLPMEELPKKSARDVEIFLKKNY